MSKTRKLSYPKDDRSMSPIYGCPEKQFNLLSLILLSPSRAIFSLTVRLFFYRKRCFFVDLFVRVSNSVAVDMYHRLGYIVYRKVIDYYSGDVDEDAYGELNLHKLTKIILLYLN